jgi:hypothetical protein
MDIRKLKHLTLEEQFEIAVSYNATPQILAIVNKARKVGNKELFLKGMDLLGNISHEDL